MCNYSCIGVLKIQAGRCPKECEKSLKQTVPVLWCYISYNKAGKYCWPSQTLASHQLMRILIGWVSMAIQALENRPHAAIYAAVWSPGTNVPACQSWVVPPIHPSIHATSCNGLLGRDPDIQACEPQNPAVEVTPDPSESQALCPQWVQSPGSRVLVKGGRALPKGILAHSIFYDHPGMFTACSNTRILIIWRLCWPRYFRKYNRI